LMAASLALSAAAARSSIAADPGNSPLSITETPQLIAGAGRS
jgi:hypothetical protein